MPSCFVIQPFDKGAFDKRYQDVLEPAIVAAGLEAYRVDRDPSASIPIEQIEHGIRTAQVCLADITTDNPNVWFEVGFAFASGKDVALVAAVSRQRFPFDIQHRQVIRYETDSSSDFDDLRERVTKRLKAILSKEAKIDTLAAGVASPLAQLEGLASHEMVALVAIGENIDKPTDSASTWVIRQDMERAGFTRIATTLGLVALLDKGLATSREQDDQNGDPYTVYQLSELGMAWLHGNQDRLVLKKPRPKGARESDDDVPF